MENELVFQTAHAMADAARDVILPYFRNPGLRSDNKLASGFDPVTEADRQAERAMRNVLRENRPADAILGEEYGPKTGDSGLTWVLDPIDGTRAFISGMHSWGVLIGLTDETGPIYGVVDHPSIGERFEGGLGRARMVSASTQLPLSVRRGVGMAQATLLSTFPEIGSDDERAAFRRVSDKARLTRYGLDCYGYMLLAMGMVDLVIEAGLQPYDVAAPIAVVQAAGGIVTDWQGGPAHHGGQIIAAGSPEIHAYALNLLAG